VDLARAVTDLVQEALSNARKVGTVTGTSGTRVVVTVGTSSLTLPRLASYTPTVGDVVHIDATVPNAWLVIGKTA